MSTERMTSINPPDSGFPDDLPTLTEIVAAAVPHPHPALSAEERQLLLQQLETRIETLFTRKLALRLEQVQRQTVKQAISELKAELPELLREALDTHFDSRQ
jgi:hypothetical protein